MERLFEDVRANLPTDIDVSVRTNSFVSKGALRRLADAALAYNARGSLNHIVGDVHYLAWFLPQKGTILTIHDCVSLERMTGIRRKAFWFLWYWLPLQHAEAVTVVSDYTRRALLEWVPLPSERIHVIPPPVSPEFKYAPAPARTGRLRLLQVGTNPNKNLGRVIAASMGLPVTLVIIGRLNPTTTAQLQASDVAYENYFDLSREDLLEQYRRCDAVVFASTYEGFGLPIVEAQAVGRPVITSTLCSMPEAAGGAACLVDPFDTAAIRRAICLFIDDPAYCEELVRGGLANVTKYTAERIAGQYAALYRSLTPARRQQPDNS